MPSNKYSALPIDVWLITAIAGPLLYYSKGNWTEVLAIALVLSLLTWCAVRFGRHWGGPVYAFIQVLWISILLSQLLDYSARCWPTGERTFPVVPLTLLFMAAISVFKGSRAVTSGMSIIFWISLFLIGIVTIAGLPNVNVQYLHPTEQEISAELMIVFLIPGAVGFFEQKKCGNRYFVLITLIAVAISMWICGSLSAEVAKQHSWPFYEAAKSVQLFNVAKRFESLVSVGVTLCNYALYSLLLCSVESIGGRFNRRKEAIICAVGLSASIMLLGWSINPAISVFICLILWVILPFLGLLNKKERELKRNLKFIEKSP